MTSNDPNMKSDPPLGITAAEKTSERRLPCCSTFSSTFCCFTADLKRTCQDGHSSLQEAQERFWIHDLAAWILRTKKSQKCCVYSHRKKTGRLQKVSLHSRDIGASYGIKIQASSFLQQVWCLHLGCGRFWRQSDVERVFSKLREPKFQWLDI